MVLLIIGTAAAFSWQMAFLRVPATLVAWMQTISDNPIIILLLLNLIMLVLGTFMDMGPTTIITTPIFLPIVQAYGIDPVHFVVIMILNYGIGLNTPPVGGVQFLAKSPFGRRCVPFGPSTGPEWSSCCSSHTFRRCRSGFLRFSNRSNNMSADLTDLKVERKPKLSENVAQTLRGQIISGDFMVGEKLPTESRMSEIFGVSRTVVREAKYSNAAIPQQAGSKGRP